MEVGIFNLYWFIGAFITVYLLYLIFYIIRYKEYDEKKGTIEVVFLIKRYKLDMKKIHYRVFLNIIGLVAAFDIAFVSTFITLFIKNIYLSLIIGGIMLVPVIIITFGFVGKYYVKKGFVKNDKHKKN